MKSRTLLFIIAVLTLSCTPSEKPEVVVQSHTQTPKALQEANNSSLIPKLSRGKKNIVDRLYEEAIESDKKLQALVERINMIHTAEEDSLKAYRNYNAYNQNYWFFINKYATQVKDSVMRNELLAIIDQAKKQHEKRTTITTALAQTISEREVTLHDQEIMMKFMVTLPMMINYQRNERPSEKPLVQIIKQYDSLILDVKEYSTFRK
ncbi:hypothetical protein FUAX_04860 [Fulvitalea axinellae]|uniref:Lipoprotein n=1 Tax=Fulvitalea axinellae TaxID=1182444 RepID=A0AAU9C7U0_9BACT|nr:hypothetical protein FUAX_04860 [Fulvitalea axinellae]